jgi:hypothetical protein
VWENDIVFSKLFYWENIFVKSPYYERGKKEKKKGIHTPAPPSPQPFFPNHPTPPKKYLLGKKTSLPLPHTN